MNTLKTVTSPKRSQIVLAFAAIYLIWGSTYLAIRIAIETIPPFTMAGARFVLAGVALYVWQRWKGAAPLAPIYWRDTTLLGALMVGLGNGGVTFASQKVPSGLTALLIAGTPFWIALLDWVLVQGGIVPLCAHWLGLSSVLRESVCWLARARKPPEPSI